MKAILRMTIVCALLGVCQWAYPQVLQPRLKPKIRKLGEWLPGGGVSPAAIKSAYGFDPIYQAGFTGNAQDIAIATYGDASLENIRYYFSNLGLSALPTVDLTPLGGNLTYDEGMAAETELDAELAGMIAPNSKIHIFASGDNSESGEAELFKAILDDNRAKIIIYNWGANESDVSPTHASAKSALFDRALAQGVNIFVASGSGAADAPSGTSAMPVASWPEGHPLVTAVGGTSFALNPSSGILQESVYSVGGVSSLWPMPSWQTQWGLRYVGRATPDVAFFSDPTSAQAIYTGAGSNAKWIIVGGTDLASAQWAGYMALVNEARTVKGKLPLGNFNSILYNLSAAELSALFHDLKAGSVGNASAVPGWDILNGWGSMRGDLLFARLIQ